MELGSTRYLDLHRSIFLSKLYLEHLLRNCNFDNGVDNAGDVTIIGILVLTILR